MTSRQRLSPTTKDVSSLYDMYKSGQLVLRPDYQRLSVWPRSAQAYLIDTILSNKPIPMLFLDKSIDTGASKMIYRVIDGQQRLRAVFGFIENFFRTSKSDKPDLDGKFFKGLPESVRHQLLAYDFVVMELFGFSEKDLRDIFMRMNRYVVRLNPQELRQAKAPSGPFSTLVSRMTKEPLWKGVNFFSDLKMSRQQDQEFLAELAILYWEGPQDKKGSVDTYYDATAEQLGDESDLLHSFARCLHFIRESFPDLKATIFARRADFYGLMGTLFEILGSEGNNLEPFQLPLDAGLRLREFSDRVKQVSSEGQKDDTDEQVNIYIESVSRQTDNLKPRQNRIQVLKQVALGAIS